MATTKLLPLDKVQIGGAAHVQTRGERLQNGHAAQAKLSQIGEVSQEGQSVFGNAPMFEAASGSNALLEASRDGAAPCFGYLPAQL